MTRVMHLDKGPKGMSASTACGRNILRTPMSTSWAEFKAEAYKNQCVKCLASKQFDFLTRMDAKKAALV